MSHDSRSNSSVIIFIVVIFGISVVITDINMAVRYRCSYIEAEPVPKTPSIHIVPTLGSKVYKWYLLWAIWSLRESAT